MMPLLPLFPLLVASAVGAAAPAPFLLPGAIVDWNAGTVPRDTAWLGLVCRAADCALREVVVQLRSDVAVDVLDASVPIDVVAIDEPDLVSAFAGVTLSAGAVDTVYTTRSSGQGGQVDTHRFRVYWKGQPLSLEGVSDPENASVDYTLRFAGTQQALLSTAAEGHYGGDTTPVLHFVGDLDRDGQPDLLLEIPDDNCGYDHRLYLSSAAAAGDLVGLALQQQGSLPACGC